MKAVYIEQTGGPEALHYGDRPMPEPAKGEVLLKLAYAGVNFTDLNARSGVNKVPLPAVLGSEGAGTVERVPGDRAA
jgi:NADPH2:quinone reductase